MPQGHNTLSTFHWHSVNWAKAEKHVRNLQARIAKAAKAGKWRKVKSLQRLLVRSWHAKLLAVKRVTSNKGKNTPGIDGEIWSTPKDKEAGVRRLGEKRYIPKPLKRIFIPKPNGKKRPISIPCMIDRAKQDLHKQALEPIAETYADKNSYGFRLRRSAQDAIEQCFNVLARKNSAQVIFEGDIDGFFDNISFKWMLDNIPMDKKILKLWLKAGYIHKGKLFATERGTPQGSIISPVLSNMVLDGLEDEIKNLKIPKVNFIRFADDFIVTGPDKETLEDRIQPVVEAFLNIRGVKLSKEKTKISHIDQGFNFLGFNLRKYKGKLLIKPAKDKTLKHRRSVREIIKKGKAWKQDNLIRKLNPKLRGWANFYRHVVSKETFNKNDSEVWKALWRWAKRRHPNKRKDWIIRKYFKELNGREWIFNSSKSGLKIVLQAQIPIERHIKIKGECNPYDPEWKEYLQSRVVKDRSRSQDSDYRRRILQQQTGICPVCKTLLDLDDAEQIDLHHIIPKEEGGTDQISNMLLLHTNCHRSIHYRKDLQPAD